MEMDLSTLLSLGTSSLHLVSLMLLVLGANTPELNMPVVLQLTVQILVIIVGEKLTDDEVDALLAGLDDGQGQINYEGIIITSCVSIQLV